LLRERAGGSNPTGISFHQNHATVRSDAVSTINQQASVRESHCSQDIGTTQWVTFRLAREEYGVEITKVQEIILMGEITRVPQTPDYIRGLINLRSAVIPLVDLRLRFGLPEEDPTDETRIMVIHVAGNTTGIIVDAVGEVLSISQDQIAPLPSGAGPGRECSRGLVKLENRLLILLDANEILGPEETAAVEAIAAGSPT
jgi:purine-binding chemotaxis protein CheW